MISVKRSILTITAISVGAMSTYTLAQAEGPPDKVTEWVFQPAFDSSDAGWDKGLVPWAEAVEEATEGTVKIKLMPAGSPLCQPSCPVGDFA